MQLLRWGFRCQDLHAQGLSGTREAPETVEVEYELEPTFWDTIRSLVGMKVEQRTAIRREKKRASRRWRWQTHAEVEEESGVMRHDEFMS